MKRKTGKETGTITCTENDMQESHQFNQAKVAEFKKSFEYWRRIGDSRINPSQLFQSARNLYNFDTYLLQIFKDVKLEDRSLSIT